jgi:hypothetical protein
MISAVGSHPDYAVTTLGNTMNDIASARRTVVTLSGVLMLVAAGSLTAAPPTDATSGSGLLWEPSTTESITAYRPYDFQTRGTSGLQIRFGYATPFPGSDTPLLAGLAGTAGTGRAANEVSVSWQRMTAGLLFGRASGWQDDPFRINSPGVESTSVGLSGAYRFAAKWDVTGAYLGTYADAPPPTLDSSSRRTSLRTQGLSFGLAKSETWRHGDRLAISLAQPDRVQPGMRDLSYDGADGFESDRSNTMRPGLREWTTTLNYFAPLSRHAGLGLTLVNRSRLTNDANLSDERIMSIRFSTRF